MQINILWYSFNINQDREKRVYIELKFSCIFLQFLLATISIIDGEIIKYEQTKNGLFEYKLNQNGMQSGSFGSIYNVSYHIKS